MKFQPMARAVLVATMVFAVGGVTEAANTDKTLVSWVTLMDKNIKAGSVLTVQVGPAFDGIVFAERAAGKWMAGSDGFRRTGKNPGAFPAENADSKTLVQMAIVYKDDQISIYRDGKPYASYKAGNIDLLGGKSNIAVFGLRHIGGNGGIGGSIDDARIYSKALTVEEIKSLAPNKASTIEPYAWWDFEGKEVKERTGRYPHSKMSGGAKLAGGKLVLGKTALLVSARTKEAAAMTSRRSGQPRFTGPYVPETPAWPANPPKNWLTFHLVHPGPGRAMPGDPNPAFFYKGRYHMHYIYRNHTGFVFAHVSSTDMVHWKWHPTVLAPPTTGHGMFSGTGFFTKEGKAVMIYHGQGSGRNWLAYALDDNMDKWSKPEAIEPKTKDGQAAKMRHWDPDCWLNGGTYYALSGGGDPTFMKSGDLKNWLYLGKLLHDDYPANLAIKRTEDISCANMFKIGNKWMLLCISHRLGCRYYLGDFKDEKYLPDFHAMMSWNGNQFFAPESMLTKDGRRVMWAWLLRVPVAPDGIQCLPRELELPADGVLRIKPLRELEQLRFEEKTESKITVKSGETYKLKNVASDALELKLEFKSPKAKEFGIDVLCDKDGKSGLRISVNAKSKTLKVGPVSAPFALKDGEDLTLRVFIDKNLVEVFANDRQAVMNAPKLVSLDNTGARLFRVDGDLKVEAVTSWKMKSVYPKASPGPAGKATVVFADSFDGKLAAGWQWLREDAKAWRIKDGGLEIRVQPGVAGNVRNALLCPSPDRAKGKFAIEVTVTNHTHPTANFEQAGITLYHNGRPGRKLVKELVRGKLCVVPGLKPMTAKTVQLRFIVDAKSWTAYYRPDAKGEFLPAGKGGLPAPGKDQISIQCYNGPPDAEHWIRFDDFRIVKLAD
ncbi:MAG: GH32 C-terminal domain-containing protein [Phycisphaerae bacterium]|nr:GH32 C-terminal domain-containing protein [Phycisphaerae bacterium]